MGKTKGRLPYCDPRGQYQPGQLYYELKGDVKHAYRINSILYGADGDEKLDDRLRKYIS